MSLSEGTLPTPTNITRLDIYFETSVLHVLLKIPLPTARHSVIEPNKYEGGAEEETPTLTNPQGDEV